jgi:hypothetical protein
LVTVDVTFAGDLPLPERTRAAVAAVLRRIPTHGTGSWPGGVDRVHLARLLQGGLSGAPVIAQVLVCRSSQRLVRVVKCGSADEMAAEWAAYDAYVRAFTNVLCARIEAASPGAVAAARALPGEFECVIYDHVAQHAGGPDQDVLQLQDVAAAAYRGDTGEADRCVRVVTTLFRRAHEVFYNRHDNGTEGSLRALNAGLGPDLVVEVDGLSEDGNPRSGTPSDDEYRAAVRQPDELLGDSRIEDGMPVALNDLAVTSAGDLLVGGRDDVTVVVVAVPGSPAARAGWAGLARRPKFDVYGRVIEVRSSARWARLAAKFDDLRRIGDTVVADGVATADPFAPLARALTDPSLCRVRAVVHGDMNARNVLIVGDEPYLIDYARTKPGRPLLTDFAWLEVGLMRDAFATGAYRDLVCLQRLLALACRLLAGGATARQVSDACLPLLPGEPERAAFRILFALRHQARECARRADEPGWWSGHLAQLVLAAHRTFKWPDQMQGEGALRAATAVAAVAAEWLPAPRPFEHWPSEQLADAFRDTGSLLAAGTGDDTTELVRLVVTELDGRNTSRGYEPHVDRLRAALVRRRDSDAAARIVAGSDAEHRDFIELAATRVTWPPDGTGPPRPDGVAVPVLPLATEAAELVLLGDAGAGKTAVARELRYRLARGRVAGPPDDSAWSGREPVELWARDIVAVLPDDRDGPVQVLRTLVGDALPSDLLVLGAVHLIVDGLDELTATDQAAVAGWLVVLRARLPRLRVLVCHRLHGYDPALLPFPAVVLRGLTADQVQDHVIRLVAFGRLPLAAARAVMDFPWHDGDPPPDAGRLPGDLTMLTGLAGSGPVPHTVIELHAGTVRRALRQSSVAETAAFAALECMAEQLVDNAAPEPAASVPREILDPLVSAGLLRGNGADVRFTRTVQQSYFAARALLSRAATEPDVLAARAVRLAWLEPCRILVALSEVPPDVVTLVVEALLPVVPSRAGLLLRVSRVAPAALVDRFLDAQREALTEPGVPPARRQDAARALVEFAMPAAIALLHAVAVDPTAPDDARIAALGGLADHADDMSREDTDLLRSALRVTLTEAVDPVRVCAARTVGRTHTRGFELLLAELVTPSGSWPLCDAAFAALRALDADLPASVTARYHAACRRRLLALERGLTNLVTNREVRDVQRERVRILAELADTEHLGWLLHRRFDFEIDESAGAFLDDVLADASTRWPPAYTAAARLLTGEHDPDSWLAAARSTRPDEANAAVHRLLRDAPEHAGRLLDGVGDDVSSDRLRMIAAAVPHLGASRLDQVAELFDALLARVTADRLEGLAALLSSIYEADHGRGVRMAWRGARALAERLLPERLHWPWHRALTGSRGTAQDLDELLRAGGADADLAITALAGADFHRDGGPGPKHRFSVEAHRQLLNRRPDDVLRWTLAAAATSLVDALPALIRTAGDPALGHTVHQVATNRYGLLRCSPLAEMLTAIGWLARMSDRHAAEAHEFLRGLDTSGLHDSVRTGRLVALAYLGDVLPLLAETAAGDPIVVAAARNAVRYWLPGRFSPPELGTPRQVAEWLATRLVDPAATSDARSALVVLLAEAEHSAGTGE